MMPRPSAAAKTVTVLGSTGSVGRQTVDLLAAAPTRFQVRALVGGSNVAELAAQARLLRAERAVIADPGKEPALSAALAGTGCEVTAGPAAVVEAAELAADWTMAAITGAAGLASTLAAIVRARLQLLGGGGRGVDAGLEVALLAHDRADKDVVVLGERVRRCRATR